MCKITGRMLATFIYSTVFLTNGCYVRGYVVDPVPAPGTPLYAQTKTINVARVSPFTQSPGCGERYRSCQSAIMTLDGPAGVGTLMRDDELPDLVNFLLTNGYTIDSKLTKLMERRVTDDQKKLVFVCMR